MSIPSASARISRKTRSPISLEAFDRRLFGYAAAASAAGVAVISLAQPCQAEIVYTNAHQQIAGSYSLNLNNDGIVDFIIINFRNSGTSGGPRLFFSQAAWVRGAGTNRVWATSGARENALALSGGSIVESGDRSFISYALMEKCKGSNKGSNRSYSGSWVHAEEHYLGFAFSIDGQTHYGWARLNSRVSLGKCTSYVLLTGYAYETEAGKPIKTGQTVEEGDPPNLHIDDEQNNRQASAMLGTLGSLALGIVPSKRADSKASQKQSQGADPALQ
jgi:hypothetical protein